MSKGEWELGATTLSDVYSGGIEDNSILSCHSDNEPMEVDICNAEAICKAVNNTYNAGIDPEKVPEIMKAFKK